MKQHYQIVTKAGKPASRFIPPDTNKTAMKMLCNVMNRNQAQSDQYTVQPHNEKATA